MSIDPKVENRIGDLGCTRAKAWETYRAVNAELRAAVLEVVTDANEAYVADVAQVDRMTVRAWRGKRKPRIPRQRHDTKVGK